MRSSISWASYEPLSSSSGAKQTTALAVIEVDRLSDQIEWYLKTSIRSKQDIAFPSTEEVGETCALKRRNEG